MKRQFKLSNEQARKFIIQQISELQLEPLNIITIEPETRSLASNRAQWPILNAIADQVPWPVNGIMSRLTGKEFKEILTAAYKNEAVRVAQGVDGGMVLLGHRTSKFTQKEWPEWMEYLQWFASEKGVKIPVSKKEAEIWGLDD